MNTLKKTIALSMAWLLAIQPLLIPLSVTASPTEPAVQEIAVEPIIDRKGVELTGEYVDRTAEMRAERDKDKKPGFGEDGTPYPAAPYTVLPIVDDKLMSKARAGGKEEVRVIVYLDYLPHAQAFGDVLRVHSKEINELEADRKALMSELAQLRVTGGKRDSENYSGMRDMSDAHRAASRAIQDRSETLATMVKGETTLLLRDLIDDSQLPVKQQIGKLGGIVEFGTITGNMVVATMPLNVVEELAKQDGILRIVEDSLMEGHLTVADSSTMVDPTDTSLLGLWDNGQTGGPFDPAIIDSGVDDTNPLMVNQASPLRTNFCSWYLVAAIGSVNFNDAFTCDDLQGHGTHVAGIVASHGSNIYPSHLGMAHGVDKVVNLKAGWLNNAGTASMFWSDKYFLVDRSINNIGGLNPATFADDVDGFNLSYGGSTTLDDTDGGRFWDSVISTINDTPVTISAGNSGPSNANFSDPATSYNAIAVGNFNDSNTTSRTDDIINSSSTQGPTANGRKKPDLSAPGTSIASANEDWETETDWINKSGTSMAAPMVLGVIMDLMDANVLDELELKALLINTAQKNLSGMNIEGQSDGWDEQIGYGALNAYAAYFHRFDTHTAFLTPASDAGHFQLYMGSMQDEGALPGEGRDRATMTWNRHATYDPTNSPSTFFNLVDLNMRLYRESNNSVIDTDLGAIDNVHQVRIGASASPTDVVVNTYAWSTTFSHGGTNEQVGVALEDGFVPVDHPSTFQGIAVWPTEVEPNEVFDIEFWLRNDSVLASHANVFNLALPAGFTLIAGIDTQNVGSVEAGGSTSHVNYTIQAPAVIGAGQSIVVAHSHNSYNEPYGSFNWNMGIDVLVDNTPPNPDPMTFFEAPAAVTTTSIDMRASLASDLHDPAEYFHQYWNSPSGGSGGTSSGWIASRDWLDDGLTANNEYCYRVWARDAANSPNLTTPSSILCAYTLIFVPNSLSFGNITNTSIAVAPNGIFNNLTLDLSGVQVRNTTQGTNSGWQQNTNEWISFGLIPAMGYLFDTGSRNGDGINTGFTAAAVRYTLANPPAVSGLTTISDTEINVVLNPNGNSAQAEYLVENTTNGTDSGWINDTSFLDSGLTCGTLYNYQARARNGDGVETFIVPLGSQSTGACVVDTDGDGVIDSADNCTLVINADQRDTNGDGYGNICDPDLDNNGVVNFLDIPLWTPFFNTACGDVDEDFNGDGNCNFADYAFFPQFFLQPPGPSGLAP